jgi:hypothetical protein
LNIGINLLAFKTTRAKVDDFDFSVEWMTQQNILRFKIAVNYLLLLQYNQGRENLLGEAPDDAQGESSKGMSLDEFVKIHVQKLCGYTEMATEVKALGKVYHAMPVVRILYKTLVSQLTYARSGF